MDYIAKTKMEWPQYLDLNRQILRTFQVNVFPTYIVVDTEGIVRTRRAGYGLGAIEELENAIKKSIKDGAAKTMDRAIELSLYRSIDLLTNPAGLLPSVLNERRARFSIDR